MEENRENQNVDTGPRPTWQIWCARVGLVLFLLFVIFQIICIYRGGL